MSKNRDFNDFLVRNNIKPRKYLGQNFLVDNNIADLMIEKAELESTDRVLEVGPGLGVITNKIKDKVDQVWAVEIDSKLAQICQKEFKSVEVINQDILKTDIAKLTKSQTFKAVSSLPYQISSPFLRQIAKLSNRPNKVVLLVQKEFGERVAAKPNNSDRGYISVVIQQKYQVELSKKVSPSAFYPQPKVDSVILVLTAEKDEPIPIDQAKFEKVVQAGFKHKRKKLINSLANQLKAEKRVLIDHFSQLGLDENIRAENLTQAQWLKLTELIF